MNNKKAKLKTLNYFSDEAKQVYDSLTVTNQSTILALMYESVKAYPKCATDSIKVETDTSYSHGTLYNFWHVADYEKFHFIVFEKKG
jgi:hypothetical protein